jgi:tetratricopeptide (TPR) repeat protein
VSFMALSRLGRRDAASLAAQVVSNDPLSLALLNQIVTRADGIPLFIEELTKAVLEAPELDPNNSKLAVPDTLQATLLARLDRLQGGREVAQIGAVIGREFSHEMLSDVARQPANALETALTELIRSELIFRTGTPPKARYTFKHVLVQQAAYDTLLRSRRQELHARVAKAIARRLPDEAEHRSHLLLHHATLADDHELAALACIAAAERSLEIFAREEAHRLAERGLTHLDGISDGEQKVRFRIKLLVIKVHAGHRRGDEVPELAKHLQEAADTAMTLGLHNEAVSALYAQSWLHYRSHDTRGASQTSLQAEEVSRKADQTTRCNQIANTGFCLLNVEQQIPRALEMIDEAETIAKTLGVDFVELECARANAARWKGDLDRAHIHMCRALELSRPRKEHWRQVECLVWLAMINLERQRSPSVEQYCDEIDEIAGRLDHALPPVSGAFRVLAQFSTRRGDLDQALTSLRDFDDKMHLAYVLNFAARDALALGQYSRARTEATEALTAARAMLRTTEIVVATSILARAECAAGDRSAATARLQALASECDFATLSARARANLEQAAHDIGVVLARPPLRQPFASATVS